MNCHVVVNMGKVEGVIQLEVCKECQFGSLLEFSQILFYDILDFALVRVEELVFGMMFSGPMDCQSLYFLSFSKLLQIDLPKCGYKK